VHWGRNSNDALSIVVPAFRWLVAFPTRPESPFPCNANFISRVRSCQVPPRTPACFKAVIERCMHVDPSQRPTFAWIVEVLSAAAAATGSGAGVGSDSAAAGPPAVAATGARGGFAAAGPAAVQQMPAPITLASTSPSTESRRAGSRGGPIRSAKGNRNGWDAGDRVGCGRVEEKARRGCETTRAACPHVKVTFFISAHRHSPLLLSSSGRSPPGSQALVPVTTSSMTSYTGPPPSPCASPNEN